MAAFGIGPLLLGERRPLPAGAVAHAAALERGGARSDCEPVGSDGAVAQDVLVSADGQAAAIRGGNGRLTVLYNSAQQFAIKEWLAARARDTRTVKDTGLRDGVRCDPAGCIGRLADGRLVSFALSVEAFAEDCTRAAVV